MPTEYRRTRKEITVARTATRKKEAEKRESKAQAADRRTRNRRVIWVVTSLAAIGLVIVLIGLLPEPKDAALVEGRAATGAHAPSVEMVDFSGETVSLAQYEGTPVVVNFWATWCPFCVAEMPDFEKVNQATGNDVQFIGVNLQDDASAADALAIETGVTYTLARDPQGVVYNAFGGVAMPTTVFIDADGVVREIATGALTESQLSGKIEQHFLR